jgi:hypothetical protein
MKVLEFGSKFTKRTTFEYLSNKTVLEYDLILIDPHYMTLNSHQTDTNTYLKRRHQLEEFIRFKNTPLVFFMPVPENIQTIDQRVSKDMPFQYFVPVPELITEVQEGKEINVLPSTPFSDLMEKYKDHFHYRSYFKNKPGKIIAETPHTRLPLAFWDNNCVFLPSPTNTIKAVETEFFNDLKETLIALRSSFEQSTLPEWTDTFHLFNETHIREEIHQHQSQIDQLAALLKEKENALGDICRYKYLFTSSGDELESAVKDVFMKIGFEILQGEEYREDLIIKYENKVAVVEIKGVNGCAAEKHAAQLEKWAASYFEKTGVAPKPILIVNAFKDLPLDRRTEKPFPHQMLSYSQSRNHCLLTTVQLFGILNDILKDVVKKDALIASLFSTSGLFEGFNEWSNFITHV